MGEQGHGAKGALTMTSPFRSWAGAMAMAIRLGFSGPTLLWNKREGSHCAAS